MKTTDEDGTGAVRSVRLDDGGLLLFEAGNESAWMESDVTIDLP